MRHVSSLILLNVLEFSPLCKVCNKFGHDCVKCIDCKKSICLNIGSVWVCSIDNNPICSDCRKCRIRKNNCSFTLIIPKLLYSY